MGLLDQLLGSVTGQGQPEQGQMAGLAQALGSQRVDRLSQQVGLSTSQGAAILAALLPLLIDRLTPDGQVPEQSQLAQAGTSLLKSLLA
jgi:uncharacterized protein YidB (DUF937 family)